MMNGSVGLQQQPFISTLSTANSNNYQPASVPESVMSNGIEEEPEAKIPKLEDVPGGLLIALVYTLLTHQKIKLPSL